MTSRTFLQRTIRAGLGAVTIALGVLVPTGIPVVPAVLGTQLAYDGPDRRMLAWTAAFLVAIELLFALDLGVLSLSYVAAAGILSLAGRLLALSPWTLSDGWYIPDAIRALAVSLGGAVAVMAGSVAVSALYGNGQLVQRISTQLGPAELGALALCCAVVLLVLRRIDIPFRRHIRFGT